MLNSTWHPSRALFCCSFCQQFFWVVGFSPPACDVLPCWKRFWKVLLIRRYVLAQVLWFVSCRKYFSLGWGWSNSFGSPSFWMRIRNNSGSFWWSCRRSAKTSIGHFSGSQAKENCLMWGPAQFLFWKIGSVRKDCWKIWGNYRQFCW